MTFWTSTTRALKVCLRWPSARFQPGSPGFWLKILKIINQIRCKSGIFQEFCKMSRFFTVFEEILMASLSVFCTSKFFKFSIEC
jgi:hypothetical protein